MHFTFTGSVPTVAKNASATLIGINIGPLSSDTPRAYRLPSRRVGVNGGLCHLATGSSGCTS